MTVAQTEAPSRCSKLHQPCTLKVRSYHRGVNSEYRLQTMTRRSGGRSRLHVAGAAGLPNEGPVCVREYCNRWKAYTPQRQHVLAGQEILPVGAGPWICTPGVLATDANCLGKCLTPSLSPCHR